MMKQITLRRASRLGATVLLCVSQLSACVPLALTAATVTAINISLDRRTPGDIYDDNSLEIRLRDAIATDPTIDHANVSVTAFNHVVLLTGEVNSDAQRRHITALAEKMNTPHTRKIHVVNELELAGRTNLSSRLNDAWITGKVKTQLLRADGLSARAVKVVTEHGKVYLLGLVSRTEAELAVAAARTVRGVTHIVKVFQYIDHDAADG